MRARNAMWKGLAVLAITLVAGGGASAVAARCLEADRADEFARGLLSSGVFRDAAGRPESAFILTLPVPTCLTGKEETDNVESSLTIHLYSSDEGVNRRMARFVGKMVRARGTVFGALTVHHHAPIVMALEEINEH